MTTTETTTRIAETIKGLESRLITAGHEVVLYDGGGIKEVDGAWVNVEIREERSGSSWSRKPNGKLRLTYGAYGEKHQHPEGKGFKLDKLAEDIARYAKGRNDRDARKASLAERVKFADMAARTTNIDFGLSEYSGAGARVDNQGNTTVVTGALTPEDARRAVSLLVEAGFIKPRNA